MRGGVKHEMIIEARIFEIKGISGGENSLTRMNEVICVNTATVTGGGS